MRATNIGKKESAVSPVIGVMLMLVVTIVIAAVIASFAGGFATTTNAAPNAALKVQIFTAANVGGSMSNTVAPDFTIDHLSGEPLQTKDLKMIFSWTYDGKEYTSTYTGAETDVDYNNGYGMSSVTKAFYLNDLNWPTSTDFGNVTLSTGYHMQTYGNYLAQDYYDYGGSGTSTRHTGSPFMDVIFGTDIEEAFTPATISANSHGTMTYKDGVMKLLPKGTAVEVSIVHTPSNKLIYDKVVYVQ